MLLAVGGCMRVLVHTFCFFLEECDLGGCMRDFSVFRVYLHGPSKHPSSLAKNRREDAVSANVLQHSVNSPATVFNIRLEPKKI